MHVCENDPEEELKRARTSRNAEQNSLAVAAVVRNSMIDFERRGFISRLKFALVFDRKWATSEQALK